MSSKEIKSKQEALALLDQLSFQIEETRLFLSRYEIEFFVFAQKQIHSMKNSINHSNDFFSKYFEKKTKEEIIDWIEKESRKW